MDTDLMQQLNIINQKLDLMNEALSMLFEQLSALDEDEQDVLYSERDQTKPL